MLFFVWEIVLTKQLDFEIIEFLCKRKSKTDFRYLFLLVPLQVRRKTPFINA